MTKSQDELKKDQTIAEYGTLMDEIRGAAAMTRSKHWRKQIWPCLRAKSERALAQFNDLESSGTALKQAQRDQVTYVQMCEMMTRPIRELQHWLDTAPIFKEAMKEGGAWDEKSGVVTVVKLDEMPEPNGTPVDEESDEE